MVRSFAHGIEIKKRYGQHFLRDMRIIEDIVRAFDLRDASVMEIGCGDGVLTQALLQEPIRRLWVFEIDIEWVAYVRNKLKDPRLTIFEENILDVAGQKLEEHQPWILLANLPYQITFPILHFLQRNRHLIHKGIVMVQEEVAEKILKTSGRGYGYPSLFFQRYFTWKKLTKVPAGAFEPAPKVTSRLLQFTSNIDVQEIPQEQEFWQFIKLCFHQPRRTLQNNLVQGHYNLEVLKDENLSLRAQQMSMDDLIRVWKKIVE